MTDLVVADGRLHAFGGHFPVAVGRAGVVPARNKREGDGATPAGRLPLRALLLRPDRMAAPDTRLPWRWLRPTDGWSDDPADPCYNRPITLPHPFRAERLWRADGLYDLVIVLGWNDDPVVPGRGSAIFWHVMAPDGAPTEGCIACAREVLEALLPRLEPGLAITVHAPAG
ncbi:MAG: L,D-transpeptidase family protein [Sphingomonadaceae bacterium]|uniref:L,D-transpeptidase family protein n=1 Tax=Thermaurantiacus sp. TaxID=2820283 RepID=UPI00298EDCE8|nr:L,D-transpeptidase family protein [Thermaurantiacus sp.]MCS6987326.1 L,D-transpeptidase family protein [Sphingomonadaceae bacterium]MDW8414547.1 L,D-transpeptidase family protein [Thermaurantiacus sp.]